MGRVRAYVGLGANVGDARATLVVAVHALGALPGVRIRGVSRLYRTLPVGVAEQPDFLNAVVALDVPRGPDPTTGALALLIALKQIERAFGRRPSERWAARELDLDILVFGRQVVRVERPPPGRSNRLSEDLGQWLEIPHPAAGQRLFVLAPLADLVPQLRPPGWGETVESARRRRMAVEDADAVRVVAGAGWSGWRLQPN